MIVNYRFLHCGIVRVKCNGQCNDCLVRFRCYSERLYYPLILTREEWLAMELGVGEGLDVVGTEEYQKTDLYWVSGEVGES